VAVQVTVLTPTGNKLPEGGEHLTVGEGSTLSVALTLNVTTAPSRLVALTVMLPGSDKMGAVTSAKLAVTVVLAVRVTVQLPVPEQPPPLQPVKADPVLGVAVSVTGGSLLYVAEQVAPQLIPLGVEVTVPLPVPVLLTVSVNRCTNVYVALATVLFAIPLAVAIARSVRVCVTEIGPVYTVDAVVGVLPSVV
jgi:hypothetical protein